MEWIYLGLRASTSQLLVYSLTLSSMVGSGAAGGGGAMPNIERTCSAAFNLAAFLFFPIKKDDYNVNKNQTLAK